MTRLYHWILSDVAHRNSTITKLRISVSYSTLSIMNWGFAFVDALHLLALLWSVCISMKAQELTFTFATANLQEKAPSQSWLCIQSTKMQKWMTSQVSNHQWIERVFFINGDFFDIYFLVREYLEVASQIYQAYQMSIYLPQRWINNVQVLLIVVKCISTPIARTLVPFTNMPLRRFLSLIFSSFLAFINSVVIPFIVFLPYAKAYDPNLMKFPRALTLDDVWSAKATRENQQLFVTSYIDYMATIMPHGSLLLCLFTCEDLLRRRRVVVPTPTAPASVAAQRDRKMSGHKYLAQASHQARASKRQSLSKLSKRNDLILYHLLWIIGVAVLGVHIASQSPIQIDGCKLTSTSWFAVKSSCVILNINCYRRQIDGKEQQLERILNAIDPEAVFQLQLSHCPFLQIPVNLRELHSLGGINIYNCSLNSWRSEASVTQTSHPNLNYVSIFRSNVTGVPDGLMNPELPSILTMIYFFQTNLSSVPDDLHEKWASVVRLEFEFCQLRRVSSAFARLRPVYLVLTGNPMEPNAGEDIALASSVQELWLSNTPITSLPNGTLGRLDKLVELDLEHTQVREVPEYLISWYLSRLNPTSSSSAALKHSLYGSPFCNMALPSGDDDYQRYQRLVCANDLQTSSGRFDIVSIDKQRLL